MIMTCFIEPVLVPTDCVILIEVIIEDVEEFVWAEANRTRMQMIKRAPSIAPACLNVSPTNDYSLRDPSCDKNDQCKSHKEIQKMRQPKQESTGRYVIVAQKQDRALRHSIESRREVGATTQDCVIRECRVKVV